MGENVSIKTILYATDLSESARFAAAYAFSQADAYGARVILLHVLPEMPEIMDRGVVGYIDEDQWESIKESHYQDAREALIGKRNDHAVVHEVLGQFSRKAATGQAETTADDILVEKGNPVEVILRVAQEKNCDLIVMGTIGRTSIPGMIMGNTAEQLLNPVGYIHAVLGASR